MNVRKLLPFAMLASVSLVSLPAMAQSNADNGRTGSNSTYTRNYNSTANNPGTSEPQTNPPVAQHPGANSGGAEGSGSGGSAGGSGK